MEEKTEKPPSPNERWQSYLQTLEWRHGTLNDSAYLAFVRAASLRLDGDEALREVATRIEGANGSPPRGKLEGQRKAAYNYVGVPQLGGQATAPSFAVQPEWPKPLPTLIDQIVRSGFGVVDLWERSPLRFDDELSRVQQIIDNLFPGNPWLCVGKTKYVFATRRREVWRGHLDRLSFMVPNPMAEVHGLTQDGKWSEHSKQATARRVYLIVEFDFAEFDKDRRETKWTPQIRAWRADGISIADACAALHWHLAERMPLVCVVSSGGKSLHGWFYVFRQDEDHLRAIFMNYAVQLGADKQLWCRSQFTRVPDGQRENGKRQTAYYFDPGKAVQL